MENDDKKNSKGYYFIFYWNPEDKRIFVPKRWGYGWTVNFANPFSILALFVVIAAIVILLEFF